MVEADVYQHVMDEDWHTIQPRTDLPMLAGRFVPTSSRVRLTVQVCGTMVAVSHANVQLFLSQSLNDGQPLTTGKVIPRGVKPGVDLYNIGSVWGDTSSTAIRMIILDGLEPGVPVAYEVASSIVGYCDQIPTASHPNGVAVSPDDATLFVTCDGAGTGSSVVQKFKLGRIMAAHRDTLVTGVELDAGSRPVSPVVSLDGGIVYVGCSSPGRVVAIDASSMQVRSTLEIGVDAVDRVVAGPDGSVLWVLGRDRLLRLDVGDSGSTGGGGDGGLGSVTLGLDVPAGTSGLAVGPSGDVVVCGPSGRVVEYDGVTGEVVESVDVEGSPVACAVNPVTSRIWLACREGYARALESKTLELSVTSEEVVGLTDLAIDIVGQTVYGSMEAAPPQPSFVYFDNDTGVIFDRARLDPDSVCPTINLSSDSFMYLPLPDTDKVWVFHGGTFWVRAASPFWCEHGSLIAEGAVAP